MADQDYADLEDRRSPPNPPADEPSPTPVPDDNQPPNPPVTQADDTI